MPDLSEQTVTMQIPTEAIPQTGTVVVPVSQGVPPQSNPQVINTQNQAQGTQLSTPQVTVPIEPIKPKHAGGRPCEFCQDKEGILTKTKAYINSGKTDKPKILFLNELATIVLGKHRETILEWSNKKKEDGSLEHPEFTDAIKELEEMQEFRLQQRVLGRYNPTGAIFLLKTKHGYIETEKQILAGNKDEPLKLEVEITESRPPVEE